jgi:pimeloyl-ACP methyl ester carboxylesterase
LYGQDVRIAFMDVAPNGAANGHTVVLLHGNNFAGFYFGGPIDILRKAGFRVVVPDQIGYGRSSKPIIPYNFHDMARNTRLILQHLKIDRVMVVGHSMGGMLAARFATQYPDMVERLVLYNPIGLVDGRFDRPWDSTDEGYKRTLGATFQSVRNGLMRYVSHNPARGRRSSRPTPASAIRGRSAPSGRGWRWSKRCSARSSTSTRSCTTGRTSRRRRWCSAARRTALPVPRRTFRTG